MIVSVIVIVNANITIWIWHTIERNEMKYVMNDKMNIA
jgi:hypothetical protein